MKKNLILIFFMSAGLILSCGEKEATATITMNYQMSQCADPWMKDAEYPNNKERVLKQFLLNKGISVSNLSITTDCGNSATCLACTCAGCDKASAEVEEADLAAMEALGFKR
jgi:hypothetical protein